MPKRKWGDRSKEVLEELDERWEPILAEARDNIGDISLICGHRGPAEQNRAFDSGNSKVRWPDGKHNKFPSLAVDLQPYPLPSTEYKLRIALAYLAGGIVEIARKRGITVRWGGDWDRDGDVADQNFDDLYHLEIVE